MMTPDTDVRRAMARNRLYGFFSAAFRCPDETAFSDMNWDEAAEAAGFLGQSFDALRASRRDPAKLQAEHMRLFGHTVAKDCPPYETHWGNTHVFMQAQELGDVAGFYRAWGVRVSDEARERPDHLSLELEFMSYLAFKEAYAARKGDAEKLAICRESQTKFLGEHLARWAPAFAGLLEQLAGEGFYRDLAACLREFVVSDARHAGANPEALRPSDLRPAGPEAAETDCSSCLLRPSDVEWPIQETSEPKRE